MAVTLTQAAARHVEKFLQKRGRGLGLRVGVKTAGCSGMAYKLEFADVVNADDQTWESFGVKVIVDEKSLPYIDGTELDYTREGLQEGFRFNNFYTPLWGVSTSDGEYVTTTGRLKKIDEYERMLVMTDGSVIPLDDVLELQSELFRGLFQDE